MLHADEGLLHAYLDEQLSTSQRHELEEHLAQCDACTRVLDEARDLIGRSQMILDGARPAERPAPGLGSRKTRRYIPLAWAATVFMALGVGWVARDTFRSAAFDPNLATRPTEAPATLPAQGSLQVNAPRLEAQQADEFRADDAGRAPPRPTAIQAAVARDQAANARAAGRGAAGLASDQRAGEEAAQEPPVERELRETDRMAQVAADERIDSLRVESVSLKTADSLARFQARRADPAASRVAPAAAEPEPRRERAMAETLDDADEAVAIDSVPGYRMLRVDTTTTLVEVTHISAGDTVLVVYNLPSEVLRQLDFSNRANEANASRTLGRYVIAVQGTVAKDSLDRILEYLRNQ